MNLLEKVSGTPHHILELLENSSIQSQPKDEGYNETYKRLHTALILYNL